MANGVLIRGDVSVMHKSWYRLLRKELERRRLKRKHQRDTGEEDDSGWNLPMELIEKIIALAPFPDVFKGRTLCRSWRRKFSLASLRAEQLQSPFLYELSIAACRWPTFCPIFMTSEGDLLGYNQNTTNWENVPMSAYIPMDRFHSDCATGRRIEFGGSLFCTYDVHMPFTDMGQSLLAILVANIQTGSWKTTVSPLELELSCNPQVLLINEPGSADYKLLVYDSNRARSCAEMYLNGVQLEIHIFDSVSRTWTSKSSSYNVRVMDGDFSLSTYSVHIGGNMYCVGPEERKGPCGIFDLLLPAHVMLYKYNTEENVWALSPNSIPVENKKFVMAGLLLCGTKLMLVVITEEPEVETDIEEDFEGISFWNARKFIKSLRLRYRACIHSVCLETLELEEVSRSPFDIFREQIWEHVPSPPTNIRIDTPWAKSAYSPGQSPFAVA
ncbi:hypothetical protein AXG93_582s1000 [Marchantia polymorpha subsp. ruderalis]|uniref:F-box domain-containing protein n=1 Tax=Marchantia polymorpha subsp. ruderalis TaxID=1480154 RepID=A0A176VYU0_MARPO|nr:hypothetical protein AXG93_582s1000 [Marchantia polymorpha subsp. ruderalis]